MSTDLSQETTDRILSALDQGVVPWSKPWNVGGLMPTSLSSGKVYHGINTLVLSMTAQEREYDRNLWATFNQAKELGGTVRKGEKGTQVVLYKKIDVKDLTKEEGQKSIMLMRAFHVWNVAQCDEITLPAKYTTEREHLSVSESVQAVLDGYANGPTIRHAVQDRAYYVPSLDSITLPPLDSFKDLNGYAETVFHEITHSTGHTSRLDRFKESEPSHFGSANYAKEELIAEIGAAMLAGFAGLELNVTNTAAYCRSWLQALSDDKTLILKASAAASKAVALILGEDLAA
jgi:antirestriction protein ArdC